MNRIQKIVRLGARWQVILILTLLITSVVSTGIFYIKNEKDTLLKEMQNELVAIAELKNNEISNWYIDEMHDAEVIAQNSYLTESLNKWTQNKNFINSLTVNQYLNSLVDEHGYDNMFLLDPDGKITFSTDSTLHHIDPSLYTSLKKVLNTKKTLSTGLYKCTTDNDIYIDFISAIPIENKDARLAIVFRIDPYKFLYPLIKMWPTPSKTSETLLLMQDGDSVLFLNELLHLSNTALRLRVSLAQKEIPAVMAILGYKGIFEGKDYRGVDVLAYINSINGTPWFMVAKTDKKEIFKNYYKEAFIVLILLILIVLLFIFGIALYYRNRQRNIYKALWKTQEEFRTILYSIGDGVITTDKNGKIKHMNPVAEKLTGYKEKDNKNKPLDEVFRIINEETKQKTESPVKRVLREGLILGLANHTLLITKDEIEIPIADSAAPIKDKNGEISGVILVFRDQTKEREKQRIIDENEKRFGAFMNNLPALVLIKDSELRPVYANPRFIEFFPADEWMGKKPEESFPPEIAVPMIENDLLAMENGYICYEEKWKNKAGFECTFETHKFRIDSLGKNPFLGAIILDITQQKQENERQKLLVNVLKNLIQKRQLSEVFPEIIKEIKENTGFDAIGLRLRKGGDFPYYLQSGFSEDFLKKENSLCSLNIDGKINIDINGLPQLECICGLVLSGKTPADNPLFTSGGSFWSGDTKPILNLSSEDDPRFNPRNTCIHAGYNSVALIPLKVEDEIFGLLQLNDRRYGQFTPEIILFFEGLAASIGLALKNEQTENSLRESEEKHRILLDDAADPIFSIASDGTYLYVNKSFANGVEKNPDQIIGRKIRDVFPKEEADKRFASVKAVFQTGEEKIIEVRVPRSDGERFFITTITPIKTNNGEVLNVICTSKDITHRKLAERALKESEAEMRSIYRVAPTGIGLVKNRILIDVNPYMCEITGYKKEELIGKSSRILYPNQEDFDYVGAEKYRQIAIKGTGEVETRWMKKDGTIINIILSSTPIDQDDLSKGVTFTVLDITQRKQSEKALRESEEIFRNFMEYSPVYVFFKDENIRAIKLSKNFEKMLGRPIEEILGKTMDDLFPSELAKSMIEDDICILTNGKLVVVDEELNGRHYTTIKYPINIDEKTRYLAGFTIDITEKKKAEEALLKQKEEIEKQYQEYVILNEEYLSVNEELRTSNEELAAARDRAEESDRLKSAFLANMSHEIRTPMNAIIGFSDLLNEPDLDKEKRKYFTQTIQQRSYDLLALINDILDISKIEAGQMTLIEERGDLADLLTDIYTSFKAIWCDSGKTSNKLNFEYSLTADESRIISDFGRLRQILSNLIGNAFKFTSDGTITIGCRKKDNQTLLFYISDTGIGITPEKQSIIFDRFRQADEALSQLFGGTGLGLSISKGLVELLGGSIWLESKPGKGSTFYFTISYKPDTLSSVATLNKKSETFNWEGKRLLLVEDDEYNAKYLIAALKSTGIQITHVVYGKKAIEQVANNNSFNLVLLDIRLPDIEGFEVARQMRLKQLKLPIIAQTAYASEVDKNKCLDAGCNDYISKPIRKKDLFNIMKRYLE